MPSLLVLVLVASRDIRVLSAHVDASNLASFHPMLISFFVLTESFGCVVPKAGTFANLVGQSFEVQFTIAAINTLLTTAGG